MHVIPLVVVVFIPTKYEGNPGKGVGGGVGPDEKILNGNHFSTIIQH